MGISCMSIFVMGIAVLLTCPAFAHHGSAEFDMTKTFTLEGTVTEFRFVNPHVQIFFDAKDNNGKVLHWTAEANSPSVLRNHGWRKNVIEHGDRATIIGYGARNGSTSLHLRKVILSDGRALDPDGEPPR